MKLVSNSRQIPKSIEYLSSPTYYDNLYGYLQSISNWDGVVGHPRYIYKNVINYSRIGEDLNLSRQTVSKRFKSMLQGTKQNQAYDMPPLIRLNGDKYELIALQTHLAMLVPQETLEVLVSALNDNAISVYVYLFNRYYANGKRVFQFSFPELKRALGLAANSNGNNYIISGILLVLERIGLLKSQEKNAINQHGRAVCQHYITWMTNEIPDLPNSIQNQVKDNKRWNLYMKMLEKNEGFEKVC